MLGALRFAGFRYDMTAKKLKLAHPGRILRDEFVEPVGLSAHALAKALGVPLPRVNDIVQEKRAISPGAQSVRRQDQRIKGEPAHVGEHLVHELTAA
jgi:hypothetical protein